MLEEIEEQSKEANEWYPYPKISFVVICGKDYRCTIHRKLEMNRGSARQHVERKHKIDFYTGEKIEISKNLPKLPPSPIKVSIKSRNYPSYQVEETENQEQERNEKPCSICRTGPGIYTRYLTKDATNRVSLIHTVPPPSSTNFEPKDELDYVMEIWKKIKKLEAMGYPANRLYQLKKKYGFVKEEKEYEYTQTDIELFTYLANNVKDELVKTYYSTMIGLALGQQFKKLWNR